MTSLAITPRAVSHVLKLDGQRYFLATSGEVAKVDGVRRSWDVQRKPRQDGDPTQEFTLPLTDFSKGYGFTFSEQAGVYESANGWDLSAPGKARSWPRLTTAASVTSVNYRGWLWYDAGTGYMYMLRGSYATKYATDDTATEWPILERHYFGANIVVAGRPAEFQGKLYVPLVDISTPGVETLARWHELDTISVTVVETQTLTESGTPTGGTFVLRFADGLTTTDTSAIAYNASAATMQTALQLIPGLEAVTVTRTGASNFVWTVVMTGAPSAFGTTSPPQFTLQTNSLTGGSSPTITPATSVAGTGDRWDRADAAVEARTFTTWQKPTVGPVLVRANANKVSSCATTPTTAANWGTEYEVGDTGANITSLSTIGRLLVVGKSDGLWTGDEGSLFQSEISDIHDIFSSHNCEGMRPFGGYLIVPHLIGPIRWRPGSNWRIIGAEQDGQFDGERSSAWGSVSGIAPYGRYAYFTANDTYNGKGIVGSWQAPGSERGPLTPHMHHIFDSFVEDCAVIGLRSQPVVAHTPDTWSDDNAVGTTAWSNPSNGGSESAYASAVEGAVTHYLKGLNPNPVVPSGATIRGIKLSIERRANVTDTTTTFEYTGGQQSYVVPNDVSTLIVDVKGGAGAGPYPAGGSAFAGTGGQGARVQTTITVTPGQTVYLYVGGTADNSTGLGHNSDGGYNGGGDGGGAYGFGGGGASDIRSGGTGLGNRVVVAGGGGGAGIAGVAGAGQVPGNGGAGGTTTGASGTAGTWSGHTSASPGIGGTASAGGVGPGAATDGASGTGGNGGSGSVQQFGGGGGGGYYGGGGGQEGAAAPGGTSDYGPSAGGGGGSSYSSGTGTVHTQGYQAGAGQIIISAIASSNITDETVRLVKAGTVVGSNYGDTTTQWPTSFTTKEYGSATDLWGTTWTAAEVNASTFGFVFSGDVVDGDANLRNAKLNIAYTLAGVQDPGSLLAVIALDSTRTIATPQIYKLPRSGLPVANDPNISKAVSDKTFLTPRYANPHRNVQKGYRGHEFYVDLEPEENTPGLQMWASVDDGEFFPLLDADGATATLTASGAYELNFPSTAASIGRYVQIRPTVPALSGTEVAVAVDLRDQIVHGSWFPKETEEITAVIIMRQGIHPDGYNERRTSLQQFDDLDSLHGPREAGQSPIELHDPVRNVDTHCVVSAVQWREVSFKADSAPEHVAIVTLRKVPYDAA